LAEMSRNSGVGLCGDRMQSLAGKSAGLSVVGGEVHRARLAKSVSKVAIVVFVNGVSGTTSEACRSRECCILR
jgi:hypothetical protein